MKEELPDATLDVEFAQLDLASLKSTASFAESFLANHSKLHILCCNAGYIAVKFGMCECAADHGLPCLSWLLAANLLM